MIIKDNMANMCAKETSTYMEFTLAFGPKPDFSFSFKYKKKTTLKGTQKRSCVRISDGTHDLFYMCLGTFFFSKKIYLKKF